MTTLSQQRRPVSVRLGEEEEAIVRAWGERKAKTRSDLRNLDGTLNVSAVIRAMVQEVSR